MTRDKARSSVQISNDRVVVTEWRFAAGAETGWHRHAHDYVIVPQTDGRLLLETNEGSHDAQLVSGQSYFRPAGVEHNVVNASTHEIAFIEIEMITSP